MNIITICIPVFNESEFIDRLITSMIDAPPNEKEIILIDGGSTDDTILKIKNWQGKYPQIRLVINDMKYVSHGFNMAYRASQSNYITLMGAHAEYPPDYFLKGIAMLEKEDADAVGGPLNQTGRTEKGKIIAACMSSQFGVGNSEFRTTKKRAYVQTVAMAIYKRSVFEKIGLLDEDLIRDQDDEFHYRMIANGLKILMDPSMEATYYVRDDFKSLWNQYFNYGLYKPLVFKKVRSQLRIRHLVPSLFVIYIISILPLLFVTKLSMVPLLIYLILATLFSVKISKNAKGFFYAFASFVILHLSYGIGMIMGTKKLLRYEINPA